MFHTVWFEMIWYVTSWLFPNYSQTMDQQKKCFYVARIIHVLFTMANLHFLKEMLMLLHAKKKKEEFKKNQNYFYSKNWIRWILFYHWLKEIVCTFVYKTKNSPSLSVVRWGVHTGIDCFRCNSCNWLKFLCRQTEIHVQCISYSRS